MSKRKLVFLAMAAAMGGFLFGYDTAVINGGEQQIQRLWNLSSVAHGWLMSSALWGTVLGALLGGRITDGFGRKRTLLGVGTGFLIGSLWSALAQSPIEMMGARFIGGFAVGVASIASPVYIAEISPAERRGQLGGLFQFNIVLGMIVSQFVNWWIGTAGLGDVAWRWMLGAMAVPSFVFTLMCPFLVESPRWLAMASGPRPSVAEGGLRFFSRPNGRLILLAFCMAMFNQISGINAMMYFAKRVFEMAGFGPQVALGCAAAMSVVLGLATFAGLFLIDRLGRRTLLIIGSVGCLTAHFAAALSFERGWGLMAVVSIFTFIVFFAIGLGMVTWVFMAEIFPQRFRAKGQSFGSATHWVFCAVLTFSFPILAVRVPPSAIFLFFGICVFFNLLWAAFVCPETKGKSLEECPASA